MNIALLCHTRPREETRYLKSRIEAMGYQAVVLDVLRCYMRIATHHPVVRRGSEDVSGVDLAVPLFGKGYTFYGAAVLRQFEMAGVATVNESTALVRARDRLRSMQLLARKGVGMPATGFAHKPDDVNDLISMVGEAPVIIKILKDGQIQSSVLAETRKAAESVVEAFVGLDAQVLIQEYVPNTDGQVYESLVAGGRVVATLGRPTEYSDYDVQDRQGNRAGWTAVKPVKAERELVLSAVKGLGLDFAAVSWIRAARGPLVIEVQTVPDILRYQALLGDDPGDRLVSAWLKAG